MWTIYLYRENTSGAFGQPIALVHLIALTIRSYSALRRPNAAFLVSRTEWGRPFNIRPNLLIDWVFIACRPSWGSYGCQLWWGAGFGYRRGGYGRSMFLGRGWRRVKVTFGINIIYLMFGFLSSLRSYVLFSDNCSAANNKNLATLYSSVCFVIVIVFGLAPFCVRLMYCT